MELTTVDGGLLLVVVVSVAVGHARAVEGELDNEVVGAEEVNWRGIDGVVGGGEGEEGDN